MNYILFDDAHRNDLLPFTFTRPVADIRAGILTIREKWEYFLKEKTSSLTEPYLSKKYSVIELLKELKKLKKVEMLNGCSYSTEISKKQRNILDAFAVPVPL